MNVRAIKCITEEAKIPLTHEATFSKLQYALKVCFIRIKS